ncbi:serine hydrolase [Solihabitans fulvus]|uniref:Serine hydrolase n=1 Tax=Solihabitans fulvus TaxID=1892852 RepID=A0A5B2XDZ2_9PSEU|nr:serine hydrolase [Solihabitans fulvus]KAA2261446.1 serine hydrolase [Solihabitans fulvus]
METESELIETIVGRADEVGVRVWLHATELDGPGRVGIDATEPVVTASVFKVPVALELARQAADGELDLAERVTVAPGHPTASPYGLATFRHDVTMSWHDLAVLMIGISDNVATDLILARVGKDAVAESLRRLGLPGTAVPQDCGELLRTIGEDLGVGYEDDERLLAGLSPARLGELRALHPEHTCRTTAEEITRLLGLIWRDEAAPPAACADVRRWLELQVWPHRLRSGFPDDEIRVSGKTGTLPLLRNEVGVVEYPDGGRYAVGVFTRAVDSRSRVPERDAFIGFAAARAVGWLRKTTQPRK